ncbi:unnamed protein product, partial [Rangifer tarandus platyrhynchus]
WYDLRWRRLPPGAFKNPALRLLFALMCRVEPAGRTFPRGAPARAGSPAEASQSPHTGNPGQQTWPGPGARSVSGTPSGRSGVHAWAWGWGEGCGGLGALPPWASPGPPTVSAPRPRPLPFVAQGHVAPEVSDSGPPRTAALGPLSLPRA